jgi:ubiquinone/menaquinone biosynthesis C-methylase UbiE
LDPNLRLLHDHFLRVYPKLGILGMAHLLGFGESMPVQDALFDLVLCLSAIDHLSDYERFVAESHRVLKPGGRILIYSHLDSPSDRPARAARSRVGLLGLLERLLRGLYTRQHRVGRDDHTFHFESTDSLERVLQKTGLRLERTHTFGRWFYIVAHRP